jgi:FixJ family two-component response regulator
LNESPSDIRLREAYGAARPYAHHVTSQSYAPVQSATRLGTVFVIDDDRAVRASLRDVLQDDGYAVEAFASCQRFLESYRPHDQRCLLVDAQLPGLSGTDLIQRLRGMGDPIPAIVVSGHADVPMVVRAMKSGAVDFVEKPVGREELLASVQRALDSFEEIARITEFLKLSAIRVASLTDRQHQILNLILTGHPAKNIAADLGISQRTVDNHRAAIAIKTGSKSMAALMHTAICGHCSLNKFTGASLDHSQSVTAEYFPSLQRSTPSALSCPRAGTNGASTDRRHEPHRVMTRKASSTAEG